MHRRRIALTGAAVSAMVVLTAFSPVAGAASPGGPRAHPGQRATTARAEQTHVSGVGLAPQRHPTGSAAVLGTSIVGNPGFEEGSGDAATGWMVHDWFNRTFCTPAGDACENAYEAEYGAPSTAPDASIDRTTAHTGTASAKLVAHGGAEAQYDTEISPAGPRTYTLTFWARAAGGGQASVDARVAYVKDFYAADTWSFPADGQWHQLLGSTTIALTQHDVVLAVRSSTATGPVWVDDVALRPLPFTVTDAALGAQVVGANAAAFTVTAYESIPAGLTLSTVVTDPDLSQHTVDVPLPPLAAGHTATVRVPYATQTPGRYSLDPSVITGDGQTVWHDVRALQNQTDPYVGDPVPAGYPNLVFTLDQPLSTTLVSPRYHRALFPADGVKTVQVRGQLALPKTAAAGAYQWQAALTDAAGTTLAATPPASAGTGTFTASFPATLLPAPVKTANEDFAADSYQVTISVTGPAGFHATSTQAFRKIGPSPSGVTATVDGHGVVRVNGTPFFPSGLYRADDMPSITQAHFTLSVWDAGFPHYLPTPGSDLYNQEMAAGERYIIDVSPMSGSINPFTGGPLTLADGTSSYAAACRQDYTEPTSCMDNYLQAMMALVRNDPQVIGYAFQDEYLYDRYIAHAYGYLLEHDPYRLMYESEHTPFDDANIVNAADVVAADPYPIKPNMTESVLEVSTQLDTLRAAARGKAAVWLIPQVFGGEPGWYPPTTGQLRAMMYLGMLHGAVGNYGYATNDATVYPMPSNCPVWPGSPNLWGPGYPYLLHWYVWCSPLWSAYIQLTHEASTLLPVLAYGQDITPSWARDTTGATSSVDYTVRRDGNHTWLVVVNTSDQATSAVFTPGPGQRDEVAHGRVTELFTGDSGGSAGGAVQTSGGQLTVALGAYQARAFRIG